jgi:DNA repair protein RecO (recombination protein O)
MIEATTGIILRLRPFMETSVVVHWLTPDLGLLHTVARGVHRPKSAFRGRLDLFHEADFSFSRSRKSNLHTLREMALRETHSLLRNDLNQLRRASYAAALIEQTVELESPVPAVFELLHGFLETLLSSGTALEPLYGFELKLLRELGLQPDWPATSLTPGLRQLAARLTRDDWNTLLRLRLSKDQAIELNRFLHGFLIYHLERIPRGRARAFSEV